MAVGERHGGIEIDALQKTVARNIGEDDRSNPGILEALSDLKCSDLRALRPAFDRNLTVARVKADRNAAGKFSCRAFHELRIAHRGRARDDSRHAFWHPGL